MRKLVFACLCFAVLFVAACKNKEESVPRPADALAEVNGVYITQSDADAAAAQLPPEDQKYAATPLGKDALTEVLVREQLMIAGARDGGIENSPAYTQAVEDMQKDFEKRLADAKKYNLIKAWLEDLREKGIISVTQKEIDDYYKKYNYEMTIRQMVIPDAQTAQLVLSEARAASPRETRFIALAKKFSAGPQPDIEDGSLFTFIPGEYLPEIENAAANSPIGSVQGFIKTAHGFHIIYKVSEKGIAKKDAQERITKIIERQKLDKYLESLAQKYKAEVYKTYED